MPSNILCATDSQDVVAFLLRSGSIGSAKGIVYKYRNFANQLDSLCLTYQLVSSAKDIPLLRVFTLFNPIFGWMSIIPDIDFSRRARFRAKYCQNDDYTQGNEQLWCSGFMEYDCRTPPRIRG
jgi:hypothetical protein